MEHQLKSLYGTENLSAIDYLKQLADRRQYDHESLSQFYDALTTLTQQAYPDTPLSMLHKYTDQHFINGLTNDKIKTELLIHKDDKNFNALSHACELQSKLGGTSSKSSTSGSKNGSIISQGGETTQNHTYNDQVQIQTNLKQHASNRINHNVTCYNCHQTGHINRNCPNNQNSQGNNLKSNNVLATQTRN